MISLFKRAFLGLCLLFLAVVVWRLLTVSRSPQGKVSYPEFAQALEAGKIQSATIVMGYDLADIQLQTHDSSKLFLDDVSTRELPALIQKMMNAGVLVEFSRARRFEGVDAVLSIVPIVLLGVVIAYVLFFRRKAKA